jgi:hypothetical protein
MSRVKTILLLNDHSELRNDERIPAKASFPIQG